MGKPDVYAIILCGGSGSRLWPRSRSKHPKHLLQLDGRATTLVQETVKRIGLPADRVLCITEASHAALLREQVPGVPAENIVIEPDRRGTASAIALALARLAGRIDPESVVVSLHADHLIQDTKQFRATMAAWVAAAAALPRIVTLGIQPTYPSTGFGYINYGKRLTSSGGFDVFAIDQFVEKPSRPTAETYLRSGSYLWNAGLFAARLGIFMEELTTHMPKLVKAVTAIAGGQQSTAAANKLYLNLKSETIDYGVLEKSQRLAVIPASFAWADVGSWADLHDVLEHDGDGNVFEGEYVDIDSQDCFVYSPNKLVATVGLRNLVIINTGDAVLICPKDRAQDVKQVVNELKSRGKTEYL